MARGRRLRYTVAVQPSHAGGIVVRQSPRGPLFLVVQAHGAADQWVLPKGHIEAGESPEEAALREVREESGVEAELGERVGESEYDSPYGRVRTRFFLMRHRRDVPADEDREIAWLPLARARTRLTFADQRRLLDRAQRLLKPAPRRKKAPR